MGVKLMTGATGEQNIQAADDRECLAGITGLDSYVFPTGSKLKATLVDANTVTIGTGAGSLQGSRFRCSTTTTVTIQSGTQGQYRRDIVGLRFKRESSGRESMEFQVLTGDPASSDGAASDPSYTEGDLLKGDAEAFMPLYRVKLSGINAADPEPLFSVLTPLADLGDSVSRAVLFNNKNIGFKDIVTLSQDPAKFARVKFTCITDDNDQFTVDYVPGLGTTRFIASCARINLSSGQVFLKTRTYDVFGRTVNTASDTVSGNQYWHSGQVSIPGGSLTASDRIKIVRAVGYMS